MKIFHKYKVTDSVSGDTAIIKALNPQHALVRFIKQDYDFAYTKDNKWDWDLVQYVSLSVYKEKELGELEK